MQLIDVGGLWCSLLLRGVVEARVIRVEYGPFVWGRVSLSIQSVVAVSASYLTVLGGRHGGEGEGGEEGSWIVDDKHRRRIVVILQLGGGGGWGWGGGGILTFLWFILQKKMNH